jgi:scyllo-inositol 2-dehydrogenase (NADP+)
MSVGPRFQVHGSKGSFIKYGMDSQEAALKSGKVPGTTEWGWDSEDCFGELNIRMGELNVVSTIETIPGSYQSFYKELYHSIVDSSAVPVQAVDAMNTIKVIEAVKQSSLEKRTLTYTYGRWI